MGQKISVSSFASEATESIINGNRKQVIDKLDKLSKKEAMAAVGYICDYLNGRDDYQYRSFLRALGDRL